MKNSALAGTAQWGLGGQLPTFDLDLAPFLPPLLTFIYLFLPTTESIRNTVSLVAYHWVHIAFGEAPPPPPVYCQEPIPFGRLTACAKNKLGKFFGVVSMRDQKKKMGKKEGKLERVWEMKWRSPHTGDSGSAYSICLELIGPVTLRWGGEERLRSRDDHVIKVRSSCQTHNISKLMPVKRKSSIMRPAMGALRAHVCTYVCVRVCVCVFVNVSLEGTAVAKFPPELVKSGRGLSQTAT